jgi:hypothetical protein
MSISSTGLEKSECFRMLQELPLLSNNEPILLDEKLMDMDLSRHALYFGTGLCTTKEMSQGLPIDFLGLLSTAEKIRGILGFGKIVHLIADSHAKSNRFVSDEDVDTRAKDFRNIVATAVKRLDMERIYEIRLASDFDSSPEYLEILNSIPQDVAHEYVRREWSDMEYLARKANVCLKLSWRMPIKPGKVHKSDEAFFDKGFVERFTTPYSFVSNRAGITFDPARLNACPYTSATGEKRILISKNEDAEQKLQDFSKPTHKVIERATGSLEDTLKFAESTFDISFQGETLGERLNEAIKLFF